MRRVAAGLSRGWSRATARTWADAWLLLQQALAATVAWVLATHVVEHRQPFFAPIAAVIALNAPLGQRGSNTIRLLQGVVIGILTGELALAAIGASSGSLFLATLSALAVSRALSSPPLVLAQAATGAILTVTAGNGQVGTGRLIDALIGGGVALLFTQVLFTPDPIRLLRRAEAVVLSDIADAFDLTARAVEEGDQDLASQAIDSLRDLRDRLAELGHARTASNQVARRSIAWRSQRGPVVSEDESAERLDLLGTSALTVIRDATDAQGEERDVLSGAFRDLAAEMRGLAKDPGDREIRQRAVDGVLATIRSLQSDDRTTSAAPDSALVATVIGMRRAAVDIATFAGVDPDQAEQAIRRQSADIEAATPGPTALSPLQNGWKRLKVQVRTAHRWLRSVRSSRQG